MKKTTRHVFAVIRIDKFLGGNAPPTSSVTVKEVLMTQDEAEREVRRLNDLNADKDCFYFWQLTRLVESLGSSIPQPINRLKR